MLDSLFFDLEANSRNYVDLCINEVSPDDGCRLAVSVVSPRFSVIISCEAVNAEIHVSRCATSVIPTLLILS